MAETIEMLFQPVCFLLLLSDSGWLNIKNCYFSRYIAGSDED